MELMGHHPEKQYSTMRVPEKKKEEKGAEKLKK